MASFNLNQTIKNLQKRNLVLFIVGFLLVISMMGLLMTGGAAKKSGAPLVKNDLVGVIDENFSDANTASALTSQQAELDSLKSQIKLLQESIAINEKSHAEESSILAKQLKDSLANVKAAEGQGVQVAQNNTNIQPSWQERLAQNANFQAPHIQSPVRMTPKVHTVSFSYHQKQHKTNPLNPLNYVPSGTFAKAIILGGADADASVNGQSKNNGVMLFKLVASGTLPNGQRSHLQGCFVTGSSWGDISSERAYVVLDKLSCAEPGKPIIDRAVTGWAFFGGKVGIKGLPLMRDNKVMQWAGMSGALAGVASAAQYSRSVQSISPLGSATTVPSGNIAPYAAYGGASKAAEVLSDYYVKRAEQYHPVIQVGAGNYVTIVFKDGFYLEPDEKILNHGQNQNHHVSAASHSSYAKNTDEDHQENLDFAVPAAVLNHIQQNNHGEENA
ncbi:MAG: conjugal transfer protein TraB [Gammaproteobacteria bacterium]|nr:conjugal transfer protein TraB [Gammaproteobacteria bacterium]